MNEPTKNMRFLFHILLLACLTNAASAQHIRVLSADDRKPIAGAHIILKGMKGEQLQVLLTEASGSIEIPENLRAKYPQYLVSVSMLGYKKISDTLSASESKTYYLQSDNISINDVVVTAQYAPNSAENSIHKVRIIDQKKIQSMAAVNLRDVLSNELNIRISQDNILGSSMSLQGISGENIKIMIDGVPVIGRQNGNIDLTQINMNDVERIEIVEGPLSVNYGTNALAGTINIITKKTSEYGKELTLSSYNENIGTYNLSANAAFKIKKSRLSVSGVRNFFDGWNPDDAYWPDFSEQHADASRFKSWKPREQYLGRLQYNQQYKNLLLGYKGEFFKEKITNSGLPRLPYFESAFDDYYHTTRIDQAISANGKIAENKNISLIASYNYYKRIKNTYIKDLTTLQQELTQTAGDQDTSGFEQWMTRGSYSTSRENSWINYELGYDVNYETAEGARVKNFRQDMGDYALFSSAEISLWKRVIVRPGLRVAYNTQYQAPPVPSLHLKYKIGDFNLRASYAYGFRAPSLKELYFYFVDINHNIVGNTSLKAENSNNYTGSITYKKLRNQTLLQTDVTLFHNDIKEMITLAQSGGAEYTYVNIGTYKTQGFNINQSVAWKHLKASAGYSRTGRYNYESEVNSSIRTYSYAPEFRLNLMHEWKKPSITTAVFYKYQGRLPGFSIDTGGTVNNTYIEAYHMLDLTLSKLFWKKQLGVSVGCKNLLDVKNISTSTSSGGVHSASSSSMPVATGRIAFVKLDLYLKQ